MRSLTPLSWPWSWDTVVYVLVKQSDWCETYSVQISNMLGTHIIVLCPVPEANLGPVVWWCNALITELLSVQSQKPLNLYDCLMNLFFNLCQHSLYVFLKTKIFLFVITGTWCWCSSFNSKESRSCSSDKTEIVRSARQLEEIN